MNTVLALAMLLQVQLTDSNYTSVALRAFVERAAQENRAPPASLTGYHASVESELAFILRDSLGREIVGQIEQLAARAEWKRDGEYRMHVVGFRSQSAGSPYSALTFTRMYTVPTLYGNRLVVGINDGIPRTRSDSNAARRAVARDSAAGRERFRAIHPLALDRDGYYDFSGGDTVATVYVAERAVRLLRVLVAPRHRPGANFIGFRGELDFDADRAQLVRMRGRLEPVTPNANPLTARATGAVAIVYMEFENAEIDGKYWLPVFQRSEFQAQMGLLGDVRPIYRVVSRFHDHETLGDSANTIALLDTIPRTRAQLTFAARDSVSRFGSWRENLGVASARVTSDDFDDYAPDVWRPSGRPIVGWWPRALEDIARYNRIEGMFTGVATIVRFRDAAPGLTARSSVGMGWESRSIRGGIAASLARGTWIHGVRAERTLANTADFPLSLETGLSIGPLFGGIDDNDYVDRWTAAVSATRIFRNIDRAILTVEGAAVEDRVEFARLKNGIFGSDPFRPNRGQLPGRYGRARVQLEWHPRVTGESLSPGLGARLLYEAAGGALDWQRVEARLAMRHYWHGMVFASRVDAGAVLGDVIPPQQLYEIGGVRDLASYEYKEFGGDRAAVGRGLVAYYLPYFRKPLRLGRLTLPGLSPGLGAGIHGGWTDATNEAAKVALLGLGGDGTTPLSRPSERVRATADLRLTMLSGAIGVGVARPVDHPRRWKPFFLWGASF
jgi:hypothetical protein